MVALEQDTDRKSDRRVVSDLSRFQHGDITPRNRSRNTTPTSLEIGAVEMNGAHERGPLDHRNNSTRYNYQDDIYKHYMKPSVSTTSDTKGAFVPYPQSLSGKESKVLLPYNNEAALALPSLPSFHTNHLDNSNETLASASTFPPKIEKELPPIIDASVYNLKRASETSLYDPRGELQSISSRKKELENELIKNVMNRPIMTLPTRHIVGHDDYVDSEINITANFLLYIFEMILAIIVITLSSILSENDHKISISIYRYLVADGAVSLIVSFLFITTVINFEKRNGGFYCLVAAIMTLASFILATAVLIPNSNCSTKSICTMRKAVAGFIIVSFFVWLSNLVMLMTTYYISNLNLLSDINFDYSDRGIDTQYNETKQPYSQYGDIDSETGRPLKEYILNDNGEMYEVNSQMQVRGRNKIIVYT